VCLIRFFEVLQSVIGLGLVFIPYYADILTNNSYVKYFMIFQFVYGFSFWAGGQVEGIRMFQFLHIIAACIEFFVYVWEGCFPPGIKTTIIWMALFGMYLFLSLYFGCGGYNSAYTRGNYQVGVREYWSKSGAKVIMYYPIDL